MGGSRISLLHILETGSGDHSASYPIGTRGMKLTTPETGVEVKNMWIYISTLPYTFIA
jgi:hypothetical protein